MELEPLAREVLAEALLLSLPSSGREDIDAAWLAEVRRRDLECEASGEDGRDADEVIAELRCRVRK